MFISSKNYPVGLESPFPQVTWGGHIQNMGIFWCCFLYSPSIFLSFSYSRCFLTLCMEALFLCYYVSTSWASVSVYLSGNNLKWLCYIKWGDSNLPMWGFLLRSSESPLNLKKLNWLALTSFIPSQALWSPLLKKGGEEMGGGGGREGGRRGNVLDANFQGKN